MLCKLTVNDRDRARLVEPLKKARGSWSTYAPLFDSFRATLHEARAVSPSDVPDDVITMNSRFSLKDLRRDETRVYTLVYPEDESPDEGSLRAWKLPAEVVAVWATERWGPEQWAVEMEKLLPVHFEPNARHAGAGRANGHCRPSRQLAFAG